MQTMIHNNEATQVFGLMPPLINNTIFEGDSAMMNTLVSYPQKKNNVPEYRVWAAMKRRCYNPNVDGYKLYGERGIIVCDKWQTFEGFFADMGFRPSQKHSIERIDNDGNYEPDNCKWATVAEQVRNRRSNVNIEKDNVTLNQQEWCDKFGLSSSAIYQRIRRGKTPKEAIETPGHIYKSKPFNVYIKKTGKFIGQWCMKVHCAKDLNIGSSHIGSVLNGQRKSTHGYIMKYKE